MSYYSIYLREIYILLRVNTIMITIIIIGQLSLDLSDFTRRVWRNQRGNQNPYIKEEQTTQLPKEKVQKDKQRSTKHT